MFSNEPLRSLRLSLGKLNGMMDYLAVSVVDLLYKRGKIGYSSWSSWLYKIKGSAGCMSRTESKNPKMGWENPFRATVSFSVGVWKGAQMWRSRLSVIKLWRKDDGGVAGGTSKTIWEQSPRAADMDKTTAVRGQIWTGDTLWTTQRSRRKTQETHRGQYHSHYTLIM